MKSRFILLLLLLLNGLYTTTLYSQQNDLLSLQDSVQSIMEDRHISGLFISVVSKDSILYQNGFGYADFNKKEKVTPRHLFRIGSITKTFTALAIMKLIEQGKLNLDDELKVVAPEIQFKNDWESSHPVLIQHLLEHKAGFDDMHMYTLFKERQPGMTALEEVKVVNKSLVSRWKPGLIHSYSNPGYAVLGFIIEKIGGMPYQKYIQENVLAPLNMDESHFMSQTDNSSDKIYSKGYSYEDGKIKEASLFNMVGESEGGLISNAMDMSKFVQYFLNEVQQDTIPLLSKSSVMEMEKVHSWFEKENDIDKGYGLGVDNLQHEFEGVLFKGHSGGVLGFSSNMIYSRAQNIGIAISINGRASTSKIMNLFLAHFIKEENNSGITESKILKTSDVSKDWDGHYYPVNERNQLFSFINSPLNTIRIEAAADSLLVHYFLEGTQSYGLSKNNSFKDSTEDFAQVYLTQADGENHFVYYGNLYKPTNGVLLFLFKLLLGLGLLTGLLLSLVFLIQFIGSAFKASWRKYLKYTLSIAAPYWMFFSSIFLLVSNGSLNDVKSFFAISPGAISVFLLTALMPFVFIASLIYLYKNKQYISSKFLRYFYSISSFAGVFLFMYCIHHGWFAIRLWDY